MINKFKAIEGVSGLKEMFAISKTNNSVVFKSDSLNSELCNLVTSNITPSIAKVPKSITHMAATYAGGKILIYVIRDHVLVLFVEPDFNVNELRQRIQPSAKTQAQEAVKQAGILAGLKDSNVDDDHTKNLIFGLSTLKVKAIEELGVFVSANALREEKEKLHGTYPCLENFEIDKECTIICNDNPSCSVADLSRASALWAINFFNRCNDIVPTFPQNLAMELLEPQKDMLTSMGFYEAWQEALDSKSDSL